MHKSSIKQKRNAYILNGKIYENEIDWEEEATLLEQDIIQYLSSIYNDTEGSPLYKNEEFKDFYEKVLLGENGIDLLLNSSEEQNMYKNNIILAILKYGNAEYVNSLGNKQRYGKLFPATTTEQKDRLFGLLDKQASTIQKAILNMGSNASAEQVNIYENYIQYFLPQRLSTISANIEIMNILKDTQELKSRYFMAMPDLTDKVLDFWIECKCDIVMQLVNLMPELTSSDITQDELLQYSCNIDRLTMYGVSGLGIVEGIVSFMSILNTSTLEKIIDNIPYKISVLKRDKSEDISREVEILCNSLQSLYTINSKLSQDQLYKIMLYPHTFTQKIIQLLELGILPKSEQEKLENAIEMYLSRTEVNYPDMEEYDKYINRQEEMPPKEADRFFRDSLIFILKDGIIPERYNEYMLSELIDENSAISKNFNTIQQNIILENFARSKAKQILGKDIYISYSNALNQSTGDGKIKVGEHMPNFIRLVNNSDNDIAMSTVLNLVTIYHEIRHEYQDQCISQSKFNHLTYLMLKESILEREDISFYNTNYSTMYKELDAEYFALRQVKNFLNSLANDNTKESDKYKIFIREIQKRQQSVEEQFTIAPNKRGKVGDIFNVEEKIDEMVKNNPDLLKRNQILRVEYNEDGTRKSITQIFEDFTTICRVKENRMGNYDLYKYILLSRAGRDIDEMENFEKCEIPEDLSDSSKKALSLLRAGIIERSLSKKLDKDERIIPGKLDSLMELSAEAMREFELVDERMTLEMEEKYNSIISDDAER